METSLAKSLAVATILAVAPSAWAQFAIIDDFESYEVGSAIDGQSDWRAEAATNAGASGVTEDPLDAANRVLRIGPGGYSGERVGNRETIFSNATTVVPQGETATLFFQVAWGDQDVDFSIGMTDVANPISDVIFNTFDQYESQFRLGFAAGFDAVSVRDGGSFRLLTDQVAEETWYDVWLVIDNQSDATEIFLQGGAFPEQTQLTYGSRTEFGFRNGRGANDLVTLFIATGRNTDNTPPNPTENLGPVFLDNLYISSGRNLSNPVPEPPAMLLAAAALFGSATCSRRPGARRRLA